ncbi:hypothetical protein PCANB_001370 [Pneumocystis canis]|nr:hypothetical protein PCK1_001348 [Pneumocystis canis]KAG5436960.1 hypothetical protein PCANB_001370 [Pneumocystis canis]
MNFEFPNCDNIFSNNTVTKCKEIREKSKNYINNKEKEIHLLIKNHYHNLTNVSDAIIRIETDFKTLNEQFIKIINSFKTHKPHESLININTGFKIPTDDNKLLYVHAIKLLLYFPQLIRKLISDSEHLLAAVLLYKMNALNDHFKIKNKNIFLNNIEIIKSETFLIKMIETKICNTIPENIHIILSDLYSLSIIYKKISLDIEKLFWEIRLKDVSNISSNINMNSNNFYIMLKKIIYTAIIGQSIFPEKFKNFIKTKLKTDNLIVSKYFYIYNEDMYILQNYNLEESLFKPDKLTQDNSDNIYIKWETKVLKIVRHNGPIYLNKMQTIDSIVEQWNNILIFFDKIAFNFGQKNDKLNSLILKLWKNTRFILNKRINSIFKFSVNTILELKEHINDELKNIEIQNESFKLLPLFKTDNDIWNNNIKSIIDFQFQKPINSVEKFKKKLNDIQEKLKKDSLIITKRQQPTYTLLKNLKLNIYKENNNLHFHIKLVKDIYNKLSKNIGEIISVFLTLKSNNNLYNTDINIICYFIQIIKLIRFSYPLDIDLSFFCNHHLKRLYKTLSLYIFHHENIKEKLEREIKKVISAKELKVLWKNNQHSLPNHPSSQIITIVQDIGRYMINIGNDIFDYNAILAIKYYFIDIISSILENTFNTKVIANNNSYEDNKRSEYNNNYLYDNIENSQITSITITSQQQLYFDIKYLLILFGNIPHKNKKLEKINYILNVSIS